MPKSQDYVNQFNENTQKMFEPMAKLNQAFIKNAEMMTEYSLSTMKAYSEMGLENMRQASAIDSAESAQDFSSKQADIMKTVSEKMLADAQKLTDLGTTMREEVMQVMGEACGEANENMQESMKKSTAEATKKAQELTGNMQESMKKATEEATKKSQELTANMQDNMKKMADQATQAATKATEQVKTATETATKAATQAATKATEQVKTATETATKAATKAATPAKRTTTARKTAPKA